MQPAFHVGQLVRPKPHVLPQTNSRTYCIVDVLPSQDGVPTYRIENMIGAERVIRQSEIVVVSDQSLP